MKHFTPRGRPCTKKNAHGSSMYLEDEILELMDKYNAENDIPSRSELVTQLVRHVIQQEQEEKDQLAQQEKDKSISILSHTLGNTVANTGNEIDDININGRRLTPIGKCMESVFKLLNQINNELDTLPDRQIIARFKMILKPFRQEISKQSGVEYKIASGIMKTLHNSEAKAKMSKTQFLE